MKPVDDIGKDEVVCDDDMTAEHFEAFLQKSAATLGMTAQELKAHAFALLNGGQFSAKKKEMRVKAKNSDEPKPKFVGLRKAFSDAPQKRHYRAGRMPTDETSPGFDNVVRAYEDSLSSLD